MLAPLQSSISSASPTMPSLLFNAAITSLLPSLLTTPTLVALIFRKMAPYRKFSKYLYPSVNINYYFYYKNLRMNVTTDNKHDWYHINSLINKFFKYFIFVLHLKVDTNTILVCKIYCKN